MTADAQLDLPIPTEFFSSAERRGEFAGERLLTQNPRKYHSIVHCSVEGLGMIRIGRLLKVSPNTVMAVRDREGEAVDIEKKRLSNLYRKGAPSSSFSTVCPIPRLRWESLAKEKNKRAWNRSRASPILIIETKTTRAAFASPGKGPVDTRSTAL